MHLIFMHTSMESETRKEAKMGYPSTLDMTLALRASQILAVGLTLLWYATASCYASFFPPWPCNRRPLHFVQLGVTILALLSSVIESVISIKASQVLSTDDPDILYALFLSLIWTLLLLGLTEGPGSASYAHRGAWTILLIFHGLTFTLRLDPATPAGQPLLGRSLLQGLQLVFVGILFGSFVLGKAIQERNTHTSEDETQPLMGQRNGSSKAGDDARRQKRTRKKWTENAYGAGLVGNISCLSRSSCHSCIPEIPSNAPF